MERTQALMLIMGELVWVQQAHEFVPRAVQVVPSLRHNSSA